MRFIHLSDLHLGKRVNEFSMIEDQRYILTEILSVIDDIRPDGVLIAGDIYDRSVPAEDAMKLWDDFLISLSERKVGVYAISGNHDSAVRFSDHAPLIESTGIHLSPVYDGNTKRYTVSDGRVSVNIYLLPFIKPSVVRNIFIDRTCRSADTTGNISDSLTTASGDDEIQINNYTDACRTAIEHMDVDTGEINILVAHQFVTGAVRCDSEEITVGGLDNVDASVFDDFDYVALGHIHGRQRIGRETLRYCGTPLKYSFSEKDHKKSVTVIEIKGKGDIDISEIPLVPLHDMREIRGTYDELMLKENYEKTDTDDYIHAVLTDEEDVIDAIHKLRTVYKNIMKLSYDNKRTQSQQTVTDDVDMDKRSPLEIFEEFYEKQNNAPMSDKQREYMTETIESVWQTD